MSLRNPQPNTSNLPAAAKFQTYERSTTLVAQTITTQWLYLSAIYLPAGTVVTSVSFVSGATALVTPSNGWGALFDPSRGLIRQSTDDPAITWAANTLKTFTLSTQATTTVSGFHYIGLMVKAVTVPNIIGVNPGSVVSGLAPAIGGFSTSALTDTAPSTAAVPNGPVVWGYVS